MTTAFHAPPQRRRKTLQEASLLEGPMLLLKSIRGFSSNRAMTWLACAPLALMGLGIFTLSAKAEELPELSAAFLANNLWLLVATILVIFMNAGFADGLSSDGRVEEEAPEIQPAANDGVAVHQGVAHEPVGGHREGEHEQVLGEDIDGILLPAHACFDHGEAGVHEDHQDGGDQKPEVVGQESGGELRKLFGFGRQGEDCLLYTSPSPRD